MTSRDEKLKMLKDMAKGAKDDPKGAALFFKDVAKLAVKEAAAKRKEKRGR
ncbi:hypothetical protein [Nocardioides piscis]|uniref:Uncharacterized protein n=1 Tax=Nocardioides piscis TaxID=2714938 RepID=A0A6G7YCC8_9ACTN|nr:hypothetical protein [Nocardioides piscis]QIK74379.1 hypothetical protein G7071_01920 [Nocardioides piscis]